MEDSFFIPAALKVMPNWTAWKLEERKGRQTKVPYQPDGRRASSTDRNTWSAFDTITELLAMDKQYTGYGFMVDGLVFIDVDHCISADSMDERGKDILSAFPESYAEISQSGQGLHILARGEVPKSFNNRKFGVEMYDFGRFCALTGNALQALEPTLEQDGVDYVFNKYSTTRSSTSVSTYSEALPTGISQFSDRWVISHAQNVTGQRGRDFCTLFSGDTSAYASASEADAALCVLLAFWCDRDLGQMDRIFRQSGLFRPKWQRQDYRLRTLTEACNHIPESVSEYQRRMNRKKAMEIAEGWKQHKTGLERMAAVAEE